MPWYATPAMPSGAFVVNVALSSAENFAPRPVPEQLGGSDAARSFAGLTSDKHSVWWLIPGVGVLAFMCVRNGAAVSEVLWYLSGGLSHVF